MGVKVLIADDEPLAQRHMEKSLKKLASEVVIAANGVECLQKLNHFSPDLVVVDFMMPFMNGLEVLEKIRGKKNRIELPVIMITRRGEKELVKAAIKGGINDFILKPVRVTDFSNRISGHILTLSEADVRSILFKIHFADPTILGSRIRKDFLNLGISPYPAEFNGIKLCVLLKHGLNPESLATGSSEKVEKDVTILGKAGFLWNVVWPRRFENETRFHGSNEIMNIEDEWISFID